MCGNRPVLANEVSIKEKGIEMEKIISIIKKNGYRLTGQRSAILELLFDHMGDNLDVNQIRSLLEKRGASIDTATIYRTLELLFSLHIVHKHNFSHQHAHYGISHAFEIHFICNECEKVTEIRLDEDNEIIEGIKALTDDLIAESVSIEVYGTCERCRRR